jgi:hypothetical protein
MSRLFFSSDMNRGNRTRVLFSQTAGPRQSSGRLLIAYMYMPRGAEFLTAWLCCRNSIGLKKGLAGPEATG